MKVLITGMNKLQNNEDFFLRQQLKVVPSHYALIRGLRDMGHQVEQRHVELGEDLSSYDRVIVFLHNPSGFCGYVYNGLYALSQHPNAIIAFDDWQIDSIYSGLNKLRENLFRKYIVDQSLYELSEVSKWNDLFQKAFDQIEKKENKVLLSAFAKGDLSLLLDYDVSKLYQYNPNPYHLNRQPSVQVTDKRLGYNFSSLVQGKTRKWLKSLKCELPIDFYGSRKDKQERLTEDQMVDVYAKDWFCLMPGYYHSGSGWWRARPQQVADAGSILIGEKEELMVYYQNEEASDISVEKLEAMSVEELKAFAKLQADCLAEAHPLDKETFKTELNAILNG